MLELGKFNELTVLEVSEHGLYLVCDEGEEVLLPNRYVKPEMTVGATVRVFVHNDSEDRFVATTDTPHAQVGEFAYLEVVGIHPKVGIFLDWGLSKDLLLPFREQGDFHIEVGDGVVVAVYVDEHTNRIVASTRLHRHMAETEPDYEVNDAVDLLIYDTSPLGYKAIVDRVHRGLMFYSETSDKLYPGDQITGYIRKVHNNGKIDLRRDPAGYERIEGLAGQIFKQLEAADGGSMPFNDKSAPEAIRETFDCSKKAFKQAIGALYKARRILIQGDGIHLVDTSEK